jgi:acyl-CoA reductase-like NAD-dependent aldehyde dehydrogenase
LVCRYYAENAATLLADEDVKTEATKSYITFNPLNFVVMPWNFPFYQVIRFAIPSLMGNTGVLNMHQMFKDVLLQSRMLLLRQDFLEEYL